MGNELVGDPLEVKMLQDTDWVLEEPTAASNSDITCDDVVLAYVRPRE